MSKTLKNVVGGFVLLLILVLFYLFTFQMSHDRLVVKETTSIISVGDLNSKKIRAYYDLYEKATGIKSEDVKQYTKYIKGIDLIYYNDSTEGKKVEDKEVMAINLGYLYEIAKYKKDKYFNNLGKNYFQLKDKYQKELFDKYGVKNKIYMTDYKGYFFISDDVMKLSDYMRLIVEKKINKNITSKMKDNTLGEAIVDLEGTAGKITAIKVNLDYVDNKLTVSSKIYGDLKFSKYFEVLDPKKRKFDKYMGKNRIYLTNNNFGELMEFIKENSSPEMNSMLAMVKIFTGNELKDYVEEINGEIVYDYMKNQMIVPVKETKKVEKLLSAFADKDGNKYILSNGNTIEIKGNVIYLNGIMDEGDITPKKDEFITASINLGLYNPLLDGIYINVGGKAEEDSIKIRTTITDKDLLEGYKRMEVLKK